jgi:murein DD-endopeptidase MepM/ murein hydrolase activator NlpD
VESRPLSPAPVATAAPHTVPATPAPSVITQAPPQAPSTTGTVIRRPGDPWTWEGGTPVILQPGETIDTLSRRYGVPAHAILRANNLADGTRVQPGQRIVIPVYHGTAPVAVQPARPAAPEKFVTHVVAPGDTLYSLSRRYKKSRAEIARANKIGEWAALRVGQRLTIPGIAQPKPQLRAEAKPETKSKPQLRAEVKPTFAPPPKPAAAPETVAAVKPASEPEPKPVAAAPIQFRWPVQGRIISAFGPKPNGQHNDGLNLAVPEGTAIKAAEDGIVAYAGNELKGYGNLVLIRHANGWVTAYAHASQLLVRRGETVKRGQTIARAGRTGGVDVPQLHFEIRKGSTPVDPAAHLSAG